MSTRRKVKGTHVAPRWRYLSKMFKSVEGYLNWVSDSIVQINKKETEKRKLEKELLVKIVAIMLKRARRYSANFDRYIRVDGKKIKEIKQYVKKSLRRQVGNEYMYRLQIKRPRPGVFEVGDQMLAGYPHDVQPAHAIMKLHKQLTMEERGQLRRQVRAILDPLNDYISPERMGSWVAPALKEALLDIDDSVISKHAIQVMLVHSREGFFVIFSCLPDTCDKNDVITLKLEVQISIDVEELPAYFKIPHPFPNKPPFKKRGQAMIKYLKQGFEIGEMCIKLYSPLAKVIKLPNIAASSPVYKSRSQRMLERAQTEVYGRKNIDEDKRTWRLDFESLEKVIYKQVKTEQRFQVIQEAFDLYATLSQCGNKVLPPINQKTRAALSLWLFKQTADTQSSRYETFKYLLRIVDGCLTSKFCPAFIQPKSNTLDPGSGESKRVMFETSSDDEDDLEEGEELDEALPHTGDEEEDSEEAEDFMTVYKRHREDLTKPLDERSQVQKYKRKKKESNPKGNKEKDNTENKEGNNKTKQSTNHKSDETSQDKAKDTRDKSVDNKCHNINDKCIDKDKIGKSKHKQSSLAPPQKTNTDGKGGLIIEETSSVINFDNKLTDDLQHEREMNNEADENENQSKDSETGVMFSHRGRRTSLDGMSDGGTRERRSSFSDERETARTDRSIHRKSVFALIRENTEFHQYREQEAAERLADGLDPKGSHDHDDTTSTRTRATHATNSTDFTQSSEPTQFPEKKGKMSDIAKLVEIIDENNVAAVIKYIDVYAIKLLIKFQDEHPEEYDKVQAKNGKDSKPHQQPVREKPQASGKPRARPRQVVK